MGVGVPALWAGLVEGRSAVGPLTQLDATGFGAKLGGEVKDFSARDHVPKHYRKAVKIMARDIELAVVAAKEAAEHAGLVTRAGLPEGQLTGTTYPAERMGCHIGAALIAAETVELTMAMATAVRESDGEFDLKAWGGAEGGKGAMNNLTPLWLLKYLPNMLASHVTILHGAEGPSNTITCNEASALLSIGESMRVIERDAADVCFSGGAESNINHMRLARLQLAGRLAATHEENDGGRVPRPYDAASPGTTPGEAGAVVMVEALESARKRGQPVLARIAGFGAAHSPPPQIPPFRERRAEADEGLALAMLAALRDAKLGPEAIDAIVPHASGIADVDLPELGALRQVFGARLSEIALITITPNVGHSLSGQAGLMVAAGVMALTTQTLPARLHHGTPPKDVRAEATDARPAQLRHVMVCTSSLGGQNAAVVLAAE
jgi:3-oxoacyl-[acyl-carrier-protein] synthase II